MGKFTSEPNGNRTLPIDSYPCRGGCKVYVTKRNFLCDACYKNKESDKVKQKGQEAVDRAFESKDQ